MDFVLQYILLLDTSNFSVTLDEEVQQNNV